MVEFLLAVHSEGWIPTDRDNAIDLAGWKEQRQQVNPDQRVWFSQYRMMFGKYSPLASLVKMPWLASIW